MSGKVKILVDEMDDGMDEKLISMGFDAYSVKNCLLYTSDAADE